MPRATSLPAPASLRRVVLYGVTGSGKSTAATAIAERTGLPLVLADDLCWRPGWVPVPEEEQRRLVAGIVRRETWVLDTAYGAWADLVLPRADLVVGLDYPRWFSLQRLLRRSLRRAIDQRPVCNGNTESWRQLFGSESIIRWHFRSFARKRSRLREWAAAPDGPPVLVFRRARDLEAWLLTLGTAPGRRPTGPGPSSPPETIGR